MNFNWIKTSRFIKKIFPKYIWDIPNSENKIYLSFDDGPTPEITEWVLEELKKYNAKATFFCIGHNIEKHPDIFAKVVIDGHSIGNHTFNHLNGWKTATKEYLENSMQWSDCSGQIADCRWQIADGRLQTADGRRQIADCKMQNANEVLPSDTCNLQSDTCNLIPETCNLQPATCNLFRPPYGKIKASQSKKLRQLGYKIIMWDVLSADFDTSISKEKCLDNVIKYTKSGSIIVFHDSIKAFPNLEYTLPKALKYWTEKGFLFDIIK